MVIISLVRDRIEWRLTECGKKHIKMMIIEQKYICDLIQFFIYKDKDGLKYRFSVFW